MEGSCRAWGVGFYGNTEFTEITEGKTESRRIQRQNWRWTSRSSDVVPTSVTYEFSVVKPPKTRQASLIDDRFGRENAQKNEGRSIPA